MDAYSYSQQSKLKYSKVKMKLFKTGKVHIYDLFIKKCHPLCVQNMNKRKVMMHSLDICPFFPIIAVGGSE